MNPHDASYSQYSVSSREEFITKTYMHLFGAVVAFMLTSMVFYQVGLGEKFYNMIAGSGSRYAWLAVLGGFAIVSCVAFNMAESFKTKTSQYAGLGIYVLAEALIFSPMIFLAASQYVGVIYQASLITITAFLGLTAIAFITRKDFSFLKGIMMYACILAVVLILASVIFGFTLGIWFSFAMVLIMGGVILYSTSDIIHNYDEDQYVTASLALFSSLATLFWYVLQIVMHFASDD